ncbi:hypothetical protein TanjilG_23021 [Lupinus angustifolius]|uniref:Fiber protein Fb34 n=1 Tax=Lupinus angustifolius TaxID=3871 RepID=A0A1J7FWE9_LUPAN|nr:PREDICTED: uncharacterized protein LOC109333860 [Lupinus angustifolius]OIV92421.1 hypothetical protein TanjilG_23021 [Lupinus angustifolius]
MASKLLLITVFILDLIAFVLAIAAEQRRNIAKIVQREDGNAYYNYCLYESDIATSYGVGALLFLMATQILLMVATRCFCCGKPLSPGGSRACAVFLFIICWVFFLIAEACLLAGSVKNAFHTKYGTIYDIHNPPSCEMVRKGTFAAGAAFIFFTSIVSQFYYINYASARDNFQPLGGGAAEAGARSESY